MIMDVTLWGIIFHEFDVGITDFALFFFCGYFLYRLIKARAERPSLLIMGGLAGSALVGAFFHFFFPQKAETPLGFFVWSLVALAIGCVIFGVLLYALRTRFRQRVVYLAVPWIYVGAYALYFFFVDYHYPGIILFYGPSVLLLGWVAIAGVSQQRRFHVYLLCGVILSVMAALVQLFRVSVHPVYFNFNSLYHVIQLAGVYCIYLFFLRHAVSPSTPRS